MKPLSHFLTFGLSIALLTMPFARGGILDEIYYPVSLGIIGLLIYTLFCYRTALYQILPRADNGVYQALVAGLFLALMTSFFSVYLYASFNCLSYLLVLFAAVLLGRAVERRWGKGFLIAAVIIFSGSLQSAYGLIQLVGILPHEWWNPHEFMAGSFINHNHFAGLLEISLPLSIVCLFAEQFVPPRVRVLLGSAIILQVLALIAAFSRGAWLGIVAGTAYLTFYLFRNRSIRMPLILFLAVMGGVIMGFMGLSELEFAERGSSLLVHEGDTSISSRFMIWQGTLNMISDNPFLGVGPGGFAYAFPLYRGEDLYCFINQAHNEYLDWISEMGILALPLMAFLFWSLHTRAKGIPIDKSPYPLAAGAAMAAHMVHGLTDFNSRIPAVALTMAVLIGLSLGVRFSPKKKKKD